jgi:hypothetical protein
LVALAIEPERRGAAGSLVNELVFAVVAPWVEPADAIVANGIKCEPSRPAGAAKHLTQAGVFLLRLLQRIAPD